MNQEQPIIGWREWVALPGLKVPGVQAKIDTGARSSSLHTHDYEEFERDGVSMVSFHLHPLTDRDDLVLTCEAPVVSHREVKDSGGHVERRPFIRTTVRMGSLEWEIDLNLTNRENMKYRMLLGREGLKMFLVNPSHNRLIGKDLTQAYDR